MDILTSVSSYAKQLGMSYTNGFQIRDFNVASIPTALVVQVVITGAIALLLSQVIYNLYFHPLANYPGPFLARSSMLWRFWHSMGGKFHRVIEDNHRKYGTVFRVGPNELSFASVSAFKTIYGNRSIAEPKSPAPKNEWYDMLGSGFSESCVASERDPRKASEKRALFSAAFTQKALLEQENIIQRCIDSFVYKVGKLGSNPQGVNMVKWYEMISFDIFGELAFGESFGCVERESSHFWLDMILDHLLVVNIMDNLRRYPLLVAIAKSLPSKWTTGLAKKQTQYSREKVKQRLQKNSNDKDFLTNLVDKVRKGEVVEEEMVAHASTLVMAGGETTSTSMAAITFYLLKSPASYNNLKSEIRGRYNSLQEINIASTSQLPYLQAVIKEGMRIFPAGPQGLPRKSLGMTVDGHFVPEGTELYVSSWTVAHDEKYFHDANSFKPERWIDPDCEDVKEASQPFSLGPRVCIGRTFAYAQMSLELAKLVWKYDMELVDPTLDFEAESRMFFQWRKAQMYIRFTERKT
ncbi:cytochrome P450 [Biscogniauxia marginata]|nr:cytochrome P450 [Biscogniauxia marginata]